MQLSCIFGPWVGTEPVADWGVGGLTSLVGYYRKDQGASRTVVTASQQGIRGEPRASGGKLGLGRPASPQLRHPFPSVGQDPVLMPPGRRRPAVVGGWWGQRVLHRTGSALLIRQEPPTCVKVGAEGIKKNMKRSKWQYFV